MTTKPDVGQSTSSDVPLVALVGNPNTGKTSVFNLLTGSNHRVANYPGVTVDRITGFIKGTTQKIELLDLPGTYSLAARSPDEMIVTDSLLGRQEGVGKIAAVVIVVDASNLDRNLFLVGQIMETGLPVVIALNMMDVARRAGVNIDHNKLSCCLEVPVIPLVARKGCHREELVAAIEKAVNSEPAKPLCEWPESFEKELAAFSQAVHQAAGEESTIPEFEIRQCFLGIGGYAEKRLLERFDESLSELLDKHRQNIINSGTNLPSLEAELRYEWIGNVLNGCCKRECNQKRRNSDRIDDILTHRLLGGLIFILVMGTLFISVFHFSSPVMAGVDRCFNLLANVVRNSVSGEMLSSFLADGVIGGVGSVLIFLPQIVILFALITVLEDCGYLARAAFLMDRIFRTFGLGGRSFVPLLSSFACTVPGIMAARTIDNPRDRLVTILVAPLMSCSARIPVYTVLVAAFVPAIKVFGFLTLQELVFTSLYFIGIIAAACMSILFRKTLFRGEETPFLLELPSYKPPSLKTVVLRAYDRGKDFLITAGTIILAMSMIVWALSYFPRPANLSTETRAALVASGETNETVIENQIAGAYLRHSYLGRMGHSIEPAIEPLGWDWRIGVASIAAFPARELVISTMGIIYNLGPEVDAESGALHDKLRAATWPDGRKVFTVPVALSLVVFFALCCQCQATLAVIKRETRSWGWTIFAFSYMTGLAYIAALTVYQIGSRLT